MNIVEILNQHKQWLDTRGLSGQQANLSRANLYEADLREANLREANLSRADLYEADLSFANLSNANLSNANLSNANLSNANLRLADLYVADMREANLSGAIFDFSCLPLWCGSLGMRVDDRFISQLFYHLIKLDTSGCSEQVQTLMRELRSKEAATWFKKYRSDI